MADWRDVMDARRIANDAQTSVSTLGVQIEDGRPCEVSLAVLLAAAAVCAELRALGTVIDYVTPYAGGNVGRN